MTTKIWRVYTFQGFPEYIIEYLRSELPSNFSLTSSLKEADFILGRLRDIARLSKSLEDRQSAQNVKLIQSISAGYDTIDIEALSRDGLPFATNDGANSVAVAEHTILLMLALYKQLIQHHNALKAEHYIRGPEAERFELANKVVGIIGLGRIGQDVIVRLMPFDVKIIYYDIYRNESLEQVLGIQYLPLTPLLQTADIITIHVPLTNETRKLIGKKELALMKLTAIIINTARGEIIDEQALYDALKKKQIAGAGIDAWVDEDLLRQGKRKSLLWELDNIVMTPHIAGPTYDTFFKRIDNAINNFKRAINGDTAHSIILRMQCPQCSYIWDALSHRNHEAICPKCHIKAEQLYRGKTGYQP